MIDDDEGALKERRSIAAVWHTQSINEYETSF